MRARFFAIFYFSLLLPSAWAEDPGAPLSGGGESCKAAFASLSKYPGAGFAVSRLEAMEGEKFRELFPETKMFTPINGEPAMVLNISPQKQEEFYRHFDRYLKTAQQAKVLDGNEVSGFRAWLAEKHPMKRSYPNTDPKWLYEHFHKNDSTIGQYYDVLFANYLYEKRGFTAESLADYFRGYRQSRRTRLAQSLMTYLRTVKGSTQSFVTVTVPAIVVGGIVIAGVEGLGISDLREMVRLSAKEGTEAVATEIALKGKQVTHDTEALKRAMAYMKDRVGKWKGQSYAGLNRKLAADDFKYMMGVFTWRLPEFRPFLLTKNPAFDQQEVEKMKLGASELQLNKYDQLKDQIAALNKEIVQKVPPLPTKEDTARLEQMNKDLSAQENDLVRLISTWIAYKSTLSKADVEQLEKDEFYKIADDRYQNMFEKYLLNNDLDRLKAELIKRLEPQLKELEVVAGIASSDSEKK